MDNELLVKLVSIQSSSTEDTKINDFIIERISKIANITVERDSFGNIYATKGSSDNGYKCIVSHTDTVHQIYANRKVFIYEDILFAMRKAKTYSYESASVGQVGIGGDDKSGVYTCIKALEDFDNIKAVFFRFEETGMRGSSASNTKFFSDCNFIVQCDRKGNSDFITHTNGIEVASDEFINTMKSLFEDKGYSHVSGVATDVGALKRNGVEVSCVNLSAGYYDPHSSSETINLTDLQNCYDLVCDMFNTYGNTRFEHKYVPVTYSRSTTVTYAKDSAFTFSVTKNFFSNKLTIEIEEVVSEEPLSFIPIPGTKKYKLIFDEYIYYDENVICPECKEPDEMSYYSDVAMFFCNAREHSQYVENDSLYKHCIIEDNENVFVYDRIYDLWYKQEDTVYDIILNTYKLKEELVY